MHYAVFIICVAFSMVAISAAQEMPNTKNDTSSEINEVSKNSNAVNNTIKIGDKGTKVVSLQKILYKHGYYYGKIDGDFGPYTHKAVKILQSDNGLKTDGIVGKVTISVIKKLYSTDNDFKGILSNSKTTKSTDNSLSKKNNLVSNKDSSLSKKNNLVSNKDSSLSKKNSLASNKDNLISKKNNSVYNSSSSEKTHSQESSYDKSQSSRFTITIKSLPSAGGTGLPYVWTTNTWVDYCPLCGKYECLLINPKGVYESELTCKYCGADYCGSSGKDKAYKSRATLIRA
ncbi:spore cortex-lytic enzyme precursor [Methanobrevibacter cuticularis]|uniref:Spore cortex-lytic enzyme n=1 Tax=Methanobrevibacter cuticularis TaxID=47311 RepID=A0A166ER57_9EURY|nr:peptidoglycan-binding domain-containing protein [Methanobrevibacter cuticularis]KZX16921.1 spore cortex-lytic enzyme precursor [Methanobrevibacter cuticularis]